MRTSALRVGNFTSSEIYKLMSFNQVDLTPEELAARPKKGKGSRVTQKPGLGFGEAALTYIEDKNLERKLGRALNEEVTSRSLSWGKYIESRAFYALGFDYTLCSHETIAHPEIECWAGSPDCVTAESVGDIKCPFTLKSFCQLVEAGSMEKIRETHRDGEKFYWQLVSNAVLTNKRFAELNVYMPYQSELLEIKMETENYDGDQNKIAWIRFAVDEELPFLIDGGGFQNINTIRFEVPQADKDLLTERVKLASELLITV